MEGFALVVALAALPAATAAPNWSRISFGGIARPPADLLRELPESAPCQKDGVNLGGVSGPYRSTRASRAAARKPTISGQAMIRS